MTTSRFSFVFAVFASLVIVSHASAGVVFQSDYRQVSASVIPIGTTPPADEYESTALGASFYHTGSLNNQAEQSETDGPFYDTAIASQSSSWNVATPGYESFIATGDTSISVNLGDDTQANQSVIATGDALTQFNDTFKITINTRFNYSVSFNLEAPATPLSAGQSIVGHFKLIDDTTGQTLLSIDFVNDETHYEFFDGIGIAVGDYSTVLLKAGHNFHMYGNLEATNTGSAATGDYMASMFVSLNAIPEPATLALFAAGFLVIVRGPIRRRTDRA